MRLIIIGSSSAGNAYLLETDKESLLVECGVRMDKIKKAASFQLSKIVGCLVSHEHQDHCSAAYDVMKAGINLYASAGTIHAISSGSFHHRFRAIESGRQFRVGGFTIMPFRVEHDAAEPLCFLIHHQECGNTLFLTDSYYSKYRFKGLHNIIIEANYCQTIVDERVANGSLKFLRDRVLQSHMSIDTCKQLLKANDLSQVNNIVLIHLSDSNSDALRFQREVRELTGKSVHVAEPGLVIENFNKQPF